LFCFCEKMKMLGMGEIEIVDSVILGECEIMRGDGRNGF